MFIIENYGFHIIYMCFSYIYPHYSIQYYSSLFLDSFCFPKSPACTFMKYINMYIYAYFEYERKYLLFVLLSLIYFS